MAVTGTISIKQNSQNIANNTSNITVTCKATMTGPSFDGYTRTGTLTIDGTDYSFSTTFPQNSTKTICTKTVNVTHNTDGSKKVSASFTITTGMTGTLPGGVLSKSTSKTLTNIPRASSVTCADGNIGSATTININRASSSFTHTITYSFSGLTGTIATKTSSTSIGWTIPTSFYAKIPNAKSGKVTITCDTYSGNTKVGTKTTTANVFVINSEPTIDATIIDTNATTIALTGDNNKMVRYFSNAKVDITATAKNSATISSRKVVCGNKSGTSTSNTLNNVESGTFAVSCTDSRGFSASKTITKTLVNYIKLAFTDVKLTRPTTTSNTVNAIVKGNYYNASFGTTNNTFAIKWRYRETGGTWSSYQTVTATITNNTFSYSATLGDIYDFNNEYQFEFVIADKLMTVTQNITVTRGIPIIDIGENDVRVNGTLYIKEESLEDYLKQKRDIKVNYEGGTNSIDPNTTEYGLILTNKNTIDGAYYYIDTFFYTKDIKAQIAYGYSKIIMCYRYKYPATSGWTDWKIVGSATPTRKVLFNNSSNTSKTISLSDSVYNYSYLYVCSSSESYYTIIPVYDSAQTSFRGIGGWSGNANVGSTHTGGEFSNGGKTITFGEFRSIAHNASSNHSASTSRNVCKIIGIR